MSNAGEARGIGWHQLPNVLTVLRIVAVGPLVWLLAEQEYGFALALAFAAAATDGLDGYLARRYDWGSRLGGLLDPLADKLLQVSCYLMFCIQGHLPLWLLVLVLGRDLVIVTGATLFHFLIRRVESEPTQISKFNTLLQIGLILWVLLDLSLVQLPDVGLETLTIAVAATTIVSGVQYVLIWGRRARAGRAANRRGESA